MNAHSESSLQVIEDLARPTAHDALLDLETGVGDVAFALARGPSRASRRSTIVPR